MWFLPKRPMRRASSAYRGKVRQAVREVEEALVNLQSTDARKQDAAVATAGYAESLAATRPVTARAWPAWWSWKTHAAMRWLRESAQLSLGLERNRAWVSLYRALGGGFEPDRLERRRNLCRCRSATPLVTLPITPA